MAQIDEESIQYVLGVVGSDEAVLDFLVIQGAKMGLDREILEGVPVVRFALKPLVLDRQQIIVFSGLPLDIVQADVVIAINDGDDRLLELLDAYDLIRGDDISTERLMSGAGRAVGPETLLLNTVGAEAIEIEGFETATVDLRTGDGVSAAINPIVSRIANRIANGEGDTRECPAVVIHATHKASHADDLQPIGLPRPGANVTLNVSLHEPFGEAWSCALAGTVDGVTGLHTARAIVKPAGPVPDALAGQWQVELVREREIWMLRSMSLDV
ncbi:MAG TPA: hypothetical protein VGM90_21955 [Kofleriaceae bacterium]|jgi:hypothetical protein